MRRMGKIILLVEMLIITGCAKSTAAVPNRATDTIRSRKLKSKVSSGACYICGENERSLMGYYRKMDSVGIVCLNTMSICNSDVRVYDDNGNEQFNSQSSTHVNSYGEGECSVIVSGNPSRGISNVEINYGEKSTPDFDVLRKMLCQECLDKVVDMYDEEMDWSKDGCFPNVCLVDFTTNDVLVSFAERRDIIMKELRQCILQIFC